MAIRDDHLHDNADGAFPVVIEDNDTKVSELNDDEVIEQRIQSIRVQQSAGQPAKQTTTVVHKSSASMMRPKQPASQIRPLVAKMTINRPDAVVMLDTGSTSDAVSPEFARVANMKIHLLDVPMGIQLGCKAVYFTPPGILWESTWSPHIDMESCWSPPVVHPLLVQSIPSPSLVLIHSSPPPCGVHKESTWRISRCTNHKDYRWTS